jgi:hypothetical protein
VGSVSKPDEDFRAGIMMLLSMILLVPIGLLVALTGLEGVSVFPGITRYVAIPIGAVAGPLLAWRAWSALRARDYMYVDKDGDAVQKEPGVAALQAILLAGVLAAIVSFGAHAVFRFAAKVAPGKPVAFQTRVTSVWSGRGCRVGIEYADVITSGSVSTCSAFTPGHRWVGEPVTVHESVGTFGAKLDRLSFDDVYAGGGTL